MVSIVRPNKKKISVFLGNKSENFWYDRDTFFFWGGGGGDYIILCILKGISPSKCIQLYIYMGSNLARGKIFTASIGSVDSLYPSVFIYCLNLHQFLILCSSKAMMFVKLYFRTSDIYLISLVSLDPSGFHLRTK